jgi:two-component system phosphate regulon sensor histidine kinase PhoR
MLSNSRSVAILIAAAVCIITTSFLSLVNGVPVGGLVVVLVLSFSSTYILTYFTVDVFIFGQIEKIHGRINKLKDENFHTSRRILSQRKKIHLTGSIAKY